MTVIIAAVFLYILLLLQGIVLFTYTMQVFYSYGRTINLKNRCSKIASETRHFVCRAVTWHINTATAIDTDRKVAIKATS